MLNKLLAGDAALSLTGKKMEISLFTKDTTLAMSWELAYILGFKKASTATKRKEVILSAVTRKNAMWTIRAESYPHLDAGRGLMYIYSDLVQPQLVGDVYAPLLRVVQARGTYGDVISEDFISPDYLPLAQNTVTSIRFRVTDGLGEDIPFEDGTLIVKLHLKKRSVLTV
ncbi:MAG: hypothetical protein GY696_34810 [Gammaproteobacteria bacterium]|nr:hypothetical protein [Gammaproteobacteria bacterium]